MTNGWSNFRYPRLSGEKGEQNAVANSRYA